MERAVVTVNGTEVGKQEREHAIVVCPFGVGWEPIHAALTDAGLEIRSEWIDGTGTLTATVQQQQQQQQPETNWFELAQEITQL